MIAKKTTKSKHSASDNLLIVLLLVFNLVILGFLLIANAKLFFQANQAESRYIDLNKEIREIEEKNKQLEELMALSQDQSEIERFLREKGLYKKQGEEVFVVTKQETENKGIPIKQESASLWDKIAEFFSNIF